MDRRICFLSKRLDAAVVVDNAGKDPDRVFFGATVSVLDDTGAQRTVSIVGTDEVDPDRAQVSWISPISKSLLNASVGDVVVLKTPRGIESLEIVEIRYEVLR